MTQQKPNLLWIVVAIVCVGLLIVEILFVQTGVFQVVISVAVIAGLIYAVTKLFKRQL